MASANALQAADMVLALNAHHLGCSIQENGADGDEDTEQLLPAHLVARASAVWHNVGEWRS